MMLYGVFLMLYGVSNLVLDRFLWRRRRVRAEDLGMVIIEVFNVVNTLEKIANTLEKIVNTLEKIINTLEKIIL